MNVRKVLTACLCLQVAVLSVVILNNNQQQINSKLVDFDIFKVDKITISDSAQPNFTLKKQGELWNIPIIFDFPASVDRVNKFLMRLSSLEKSQPVAVTDESALRFKVGAANFEKKISFSANDETLATVLLGASPTFNKVYVKLHNDNGIYLIPLNINEISSKHVDWMSRDQLHVDLEKISGVTNDNFNLKKIQKEFLLQEMSENQIADKAKIDSLVNNLVKINYRDVIGLKKGSSKPELTYSLQLASGNTIDYHFNKISDDSYSLQTSDSDYMYLVDEKTYKNVSIEKNKLLADAEID